MKMFQSKRFWVGITIITTLIALHMSGFFDFITLAYLKEKRVLLQGYVDSRYSLSVFVYIMWYIGIVVLALPVTALTTILGGFLFGVILYFCYGGTSVRPTAETRTVALSVGLIEFFCSTASGILLTTEILTP